MKIDVLPSKNPIKKSSFSKSSFTYKRLLVFAVVFSLAGGVVLWRTYANAPVIASLEAEQMIPPRGASVQNSSAASGGKVMLLAKDATATGSVILPSRSSSLSVIAKSGMLCSRNLNISISIDGQPAINPRTITSSWRTYSANVSTGSGPHSVSVTVSNIGTQIYCAGVYLDVIRFSGTDNTVPAPTISLSASPSTVSKGASSTLTWYGANASSCMASGSWSGSKPTQGSVSSGAVNINSIYTLSCTGAGGTATASAEVKVTGVQDPQPPPPPPPPPPPAPPAPPTANCTPGSDWGTNRPDLAGEVITLVNQHRASKSLTQLSRSSTLSASAEWKSLHMAKYKYFTHDDPAPPIARSAFQRINDCGYKGNGAGENIAYGYGTPQAVMNAWLNSAGHKANIENASYRAIGIGVGADSTGRLYWTQNFGTTPDGASTSPGAPSINSSPAGIN